MYLHGMSSGDFVPALEEFFGSAAGLSASVVTRLTTDWQKERDQFAHLSLKDVDYVYVFADGIHFNVRLEEARLCALVIVGVRTDGTKELVSIADGHRESTESGADVLRGLKRRGMTFRPRCHDPDDRLPIEVLEREPGLHRSTPMFEREGALAVPAPAGLPQWLSMPTSAIEVRDPKVRAPAVRPARSLGRSVRHCWHGRG